MSGSSGGDSDKDHPLLKNSSDLDPVVKIVTDWRTEVKREQHKESYVWDDVKINEGDTGIFGCGPRCHLRGWKAKLQGATTRMPKQLSIIEYFTKLLEEFKINPDIAAVRFGDGESESLTYHELNLLSNALANVLIENLGPDAKNYNLDSDIVVAVCIPLSVRYIALLFAILKMGATIFPIAPDLPTESILNFVDGVKPIITIMSKDAEHVVKIQEDHEGMDMATLIILEDLWDNLDRPDLLEFISPIAFLEGEPEKVYPDLHLRTVAIISSSNASGIYSGVRYKSFPIFNLLTWEWTNFKMLPKENHILNSDVDTIPSLIEILGPLLHGSCLIILQPLVLEHPILFMKKVEELSISRLTVSLTLLNTILMTVDLIGVEYGRKMLNSVKYWFCVGGSLTVEVAELFFNKLRAWGRRLINIYGNDADTGTVCYQIIGSLEHLRKLNYHGRIPIGIPICNVKIYLVNSAMKLVRGDEVGEICVAEKTPIDKYSLSESTPQHFIINPFSKSKDFRYLLKTGDKGRIVRGDYRQRFLLFELPLTLQRHAFIEQRFVEFDDIELHLLNMKELIQDAHVLCHRSGHQDQIITAFCCLKPGAQLSTVETLLKSKLPEYMIPELLDVPEIPRFSSGSVNENYLLKTLYTEMNERTKFEVWTSLGYSTSSHLHAVKVLFHVIFAIMRTPYREIAQNYNNSFLDLPRATYFKLVFIIHELHLNRYPVGLQEVFRSATLAEIVDHMQSAKDRHGIFIMDPDTLIIENKFKVDVMEHEHHDEVIELLSTALISHGSPDFYSEVKKSDLKKFLGGLYVMFCEKKLSKIVKRIKDSKIVGVIANINWHDEISSKNVPITREIAYRFQLMQILEMAIGDTQISSTDSAVLQICYAVIDSNYVTAADSHGLLEKLIAATINTAKKVNFDAVVFTTFSFQDTDICMHNFGFKMIRECRINQFVGVDGRRPYYLAPDHLVANFCWRKIC